MDLTTFTNDQWKDEKTKQDRIDTPMSYTPPKEEDTKQDLINTSIGDTLCKEEETKQDLVNTLPKCSLSKQGKPKQDPSSKLLSCTDGMLVEIASKLHLKPLVQPLFMDTALFFLRRESNKAAVKANSTIQTLPALSKRKLLIELATSSFLQEMGIRIWPSYVRYRQHLTIISPYGDDPKSRRNATRQYNLERQEWRMGRRAERPVRPQSEKGLMYLATGRSEIERKTRMYMRRLVELGYVGEG